MQYTIKRTNRKTISITVKNGSVIVTAPQNASQNNIEDFVLLKRDWIARHVAQQKTNINPLVVNYRAILLYGNLIEIKYKSDIVATELRDNILYLNTQYQANPKTEIVKWLRSMACVLLQEELSSISAAVSIPFSGFRLGNINAKRVWGSCNSKNKIMLNFRLIMVPKPLYRYVILHELCHTIHLNHSREYYLLLDKICPNHKQLKAELKKWSQLNTIY
ncbi:MAG: M48 family metallopeptidase [Clostridiales bacterium]|jgi:predicted metal-dependent hydrolase|nr:M48 family metallopeptidase [Clostridiales bacterium]